MAPIDPKRTARPFSPPQSIEQFGCVDKIGIQACGRLIGGEGRVEAIKRLSRTEAECRVVSGLTPAGYKALARALNGIPENSGWDDDVAGLLAETKAKAKTHWTSASRRANWQSG